MTITIVQLDPEDNIPNGFASCEMRHLMVLFTPRGRHTERLRSGVVPAHLSPSHRGSDAVTTCGPFVSRVKAPPGRHVDDLAHQARTLTCLVPVLVAWCRVGGFRWIGGGGVGVVGH